MGALLAPGAPQPEPAGEHARAHEVVAADEHVLERGEPAEQAEVLEAARDAAAGEGARGQAQQIGTVQPDAPARRARDAREHVEERALPGAVGPDHGEQLAGRDGERDAVERGDAAEAQRDVLEREQRHACASAATAAWPADVPRYAARTVPSSSSFGVGPPASTRPASSR